MDSDFDWARFESELLDAYRDQLQGVELDRGESVRLLAIEGMYADGDQIHLPNLCVDVVANGDTDVPPRWSDGIYPADFSHLFYEHPDRMQEAGRLIEAEATRSTPQHFDVVEAELYEVLVRVAMELFDDVVSSWPTTPGFFAFVWDEAGGYRLARRTVPAELHEYVFARELEVERELAAILALPVSDRAVALTACLDRYSWSTGVIARDELASIGPAALPALTDALDGATGGSAALLIARIGTDDVLIVARVRELADTGGAFAIALGRLGDFEWLAEAPPDVAVWGITAPLGAIIGPDDDWGPLDYRPLESLLDRRGDETLEAVNELMSSAGSQGERSPSDVGEMLRGMTSPYAVVRRHAAVAAGDRYLGEDAGRRLVPALAGLLDDADDVVVRWAALALRGWRELGEPYRDRWSRVLA
jgi:hypothetical protein